MSIEYEVSKPKSKSAWNIQGKRLAIVGYSHHLDNDYSPKFTVELLQHISKETQTKAFFTSISGYFKLTNKDFWPHVLFFNFLPSRIGGAEDMYGIGSPEQHEAARQRVRKILEENEIERMLVFSTKGWNHFLETDEEKRLERCKPLFPPPAANRYRAEFGTYTVNNRKVLVAGFRHPQGAEAEEMRVAVKAFMDQ